MGTLEDDEDRVLLLHRRWLEARADFQAHMDAMCELWQERRFYLGGLNRTQMAALNVELLTNAITELAPEFWADALAEDGIQDCRA